jgi:transcriptional regulator with XRE-family HTH domain
MTAKGGQRRKDDGDGPKNGLETFAEELKAQREAAGLTQEQLGKLMGYSASVIAKVETYRTMPSPEFASKADEVFKTPGTFKRLRKSMVNGAYEPWFRPYIEIEERATVLRSWQPQVVDGLLQTEAYARAILRASWPVDSEARIDQLVTARMARQEILRREDPEPPIVSAILSETVLRQPVGGAAVMREQLGHLVESAANPRISIQVLPWSAGEHPGLLGNLVVASFENGPDAAYLDNTLNGQVTERRKDVARVTLLYDTLTAEALSPRASVDLIARTVEQWT